MITMGIINTAMAAIIAATNPAIASSIMPPIFGWIEMPFWHQPPNAIEKLEKVEL
jgi:hypothetical protein